ncbi:FYVE and coiled-coil domain-containing protein 1-like [Ixodes scapularis]|uniref:FYVE and coiled-coil domain-containing protein 1-like n=1 Tax=Ixodes scapularis TaxID=6945 RepID=UPI001A9FEA46|nr:FYVE and coiled-coil domain-containing protein 1-like [Ixodes scapularis]
MCEKPEQTIDEFLTELKLRDQKCDYGAQENRLICDRIIIGIRDVALRERLLREPSLTLDKIISTCKAAEISKKKHVNDIQKTEDEVRVDGLYRQPSSFRAAQRSYRPSGPQKDQSSNRQQISCSRCGTYHEPRNCPAYGKRCLSCGNYGHFFRICNQTQQKTYGYRRVSAEEETSNSSMNNDRNETIHLGGITIGPLPSTKATKFAQTGTELERRSKKKKDMLASRPEEGQGLISELVLATAEMQQMSLEHDRNIEASFGREQALQRECKAASALLGKMQAQQAEFSHAKYQESEALKAQLVSLSGDLSKQQELVDSKVEEANTLKEKFEASQLELERFSAEYCILQDVLLQDCGEDLPLVRNDSEQREFSAFQYLKKLLDIAERKRKALENQLAKKEEQFNLLQQNYQYLKDRYQWPLQDLGAFVRSIIEAFFRSIIEHTNQSSEAAVSLEASQLEDLNRMLAVIQERVTSLTVRNELLAQESQQWKSSCKDASEKIRSLCNESHLRQQRHEKVAETLRERENAVKCNNLSQAEADGSSFTEKAETECERLDEKVSSLLKRNGKLESEADILWSELSCLEEQAEMLISDNKHFQQLAENLKQARQCLEEELKTQREQHVKATKEMEKEHCTALDEAAKCEAALSALKTDHSQLLDKYNYIVYRHRNLQEEFHAAAQVKRSWEDSCAQLTKEWATARRDIAVFAEQQGAVGQKTMQELQELWQANQQLQERFRLLNDKHLKAEERLVQAPNQKVEASMEHVTEGTGGTARTLEAPASRVEI